MKKTGFILLISIFAVLIIISCEKEADNVRYPEFKQKVVVSGFITPDKAYQYIKLYSNQGLFSNWAIKYDPIIRVTISDGSVEAQLDTSSTGFVFRSSALAVREGVSYTMKIWKNSGLTAEASCKVPYKRIFNLKVDTIRIYNYSPDYKSYKAIIHFTDEPGQQNYYRLACYNVYYNLKYSKKPTAISLTYPQNEFNDDRGRDGLEINSELANIGVSKTSDSSFLKIYLLNLDKNYYDYYKSINNYNSGEDPFTEPSPVYSNVKGGLGVFAAYTIDSLIFRLK
jgi:hypothetical protein